MIHPFRIILQIEFPTSRIGLRQWVCFIVQPGGEGGIRTTDFGKTNFFGHSVGYKNLHRFDKLNVSRKYLFCRNRTFTPPVHLGSHLIFG